MMSGGAKKKPFKIEPFKHPLKQDPQWGENTWALLEAAILEINNHNASGLSFEELYRSAYNMVINKYGERLYKGLVDTVSKHLVGVAARVEAAASGDAFLRDLTARWEDHNKSMQMIRDILMYMDRTYVGRHQVVPVHQLGLNLWRDVVVRAPRLQERLSSTLLALVARERAGEIIDRALMRSVTMMLVDLGHDVYQDEFERAFLEQAAEAYQAEAQELLGTCDCPSFLRKAERRLLEESERCTNYLDPGSDAKVTRVVEHRLIQQQMRTLMELEGSGFVAMVDAGHIEDLARMYALFRRVPGGLDLLRHTMGDHIRSTGRALVQDPERLKEPVEFVQLLLDQKAKFDSIVLGAFQNDKLFQNALNTAFEHFLNLTQRAPEYISLFMDDKLRKGLKGMSEDEAEAVLDKVMMLFRYLQEKDVFEKYYKQHLAKRLLSGRTVSDDAERSLLVKLKTECGYQFTSKLESMFNDIKMSRDTMKEYRDYVASSTTCASEIDLSVQVLMTGSWPTQSAAQCSLPRELDSCCTDFSNFYLGTHSGRKLTWQTNMGTVDLRATFGNGRKHELNVSTYQACILQLFQGSEELSFSDIQAATGIQAAELKRNLQSLACVKGKQLLKKVPVTKDVGDGDLFSANDSFTSKFFKVKVGTITAQKEGDADKLETRQKVEEDRKPQIEAAIVRIMKSRRVLDHNSIVAEVTRQLSTRFVPNPTVIKKRIENLIEREFLERDQTDRKLYRYLA
mmetsp:Transcript_20563/g.61882  ORF Transcript_20563/g.61882 Transcript_20563/m.61882 type:complete len:739 (+) Transcript_20563:362-2578(+)